MILSYFFDHGKTILDHLRKIFGAVGDGVGSWDLATRLCILEAG